MSISSVQCPLEATVCYSTAEFKQQTNLAVRSDPAHPQPSKQCVTPQHGPMKGKGPSPKPACNGYHSLPLGTQPQGRPRISPLKPSPLAIIWRSTTHRHERLFQQFPHAAHDIFPQLCRIGEHCLASRRPSRDTHPSTTTEVPQSPHPPICPGRTAVEKKLFSLSDQQTTGRGKGGSARWKAGKRAKEFVLADVRAGHARRWGFFQPARASQPCGRGV